jgi:multidrug efflux pump subunit AcrB
VPLTDVFDTLQVYLGSLYVNDFNKFGRTYQVIVQADAPFRATRRGHRQLKVRNARGEMVPLGSLVTVKQTLRPGPVMRYNGYPAADINGGDPRPASARARRRRRSSDRAETLPNGMASSGPT